VIPRPGVGPILLEHSTTRAIVRVVSYWFGRHKEMVLQGKVTIWPLGDDRG
jgi:hypothetical protein